jgi:PTH1 family peptidyl-tRNA hydrolase
MYSLGLTKTLLIVGLGNVGKQYDGTRHNIGFATVDELAARQDFGQWIEKKDLKCQFTTGTIGESRVILIKPTTFMNLSGEAVQAVAHFYKIPVQYILAVHDELDIPFGQIRTRIGGSAAGHNGIKSLIQHLGEDFGRVRIGIDQENRDKRIETSDFVLTKFNSAEQAELPALLKESTAILTEYIHAGSLLQETRSFII